MLSDSNLKNYMSGYNDYLSLLSRRKLYGVQSTSDLIRLTILEEHGGIWFDISSILIHGLQWIYEL